MQETTREIDTIQQKLNKLMDLLLEGVIEKAEHDEKRASLRSRQVDLTNLMNSYHSADDGFRDAVADMLELSKKAHELFVGSNNQDKRRLINFVFSNLSLKGEKLAYSLRQPFDLFVNAAGKVEWRALVDTLRTLPELRLVVMRYPELKRQHIGEMLWQRKTAA